MTNENFRFEPEGDQLTAGTFFGGDEIPAGTFHGGDEIPPGTFHQK